MFLTLHKRIRLSYLISDFNSTLNINFFGVVEPEYLECGIKISQVIQVVPAVSSPTKVSMFGIEKVLLKKDV